MINTKTGNLCTAGKPYIYIRYTIEAGWDNKISYRIQLRNPSKPNYHICLQRM